MERMEKMNVMRGGLYRPLQKPDLDRIHETSIKILGEIGFQTSYEPLLQLLEEKGAKVDRDKKRVFLPVDLISRCIEQAPSEFVFYGLGEGREIFMGGDRVYFGTGGKALYVLDSDNRRRPAVLRDVAQFARLADELEYVGFYIVPVHTHDVNVNHMDINGFYQSLLHTGKPVMGGVFSSEGLQQLVEMCALLAGGMDKLRERPFVGFISSIISPLKIADDRAEILMDVARFGLPLVVSTAPIAGVTAPVTLAGTIALQNAEALLGIVLSQLVNPGTPVFYSAVPCTMDMQSGTFRMGSVESGLMNAAVAQMAQHYRIPCYLTVGVTDSKLPDSQAAHESSTNCLLAALAGGNYLHQAFGLLDGALTISYAQFVIDNDIAGSCYRALRGIEVNPDTLGFDVIARVGPGGNFMTQKHTVAHMRTEMFQPRVSVLQEYQAWLSGGGEGSRQKAEKVVSDILGKPSRTYMDEELIRKVFSAYPGLVQLNGNGE